MIRMGEKKTMTTTLRETGRKCITLPSNKVKQKLEKMAKGQTDGQDKKRKE